MGMARLSIKGILLGAAASFEAIYLWFLIIAIYIVLANYGEAVTLEDQVGTKALLLSLANSPTLTLINYAIGICALMGGGYLAARIVEHDKLLNATVAIVIGLGMILGTIRYAPFLGILLSILIIPVGGLVVGYMFLFRRNNN
ncbi:hypothetical protein HYW60_03325 [Candidatus Kaiserbacteria bacterium]|nr:hypothetical protein [Candidatus Kaiserbacteria bacterium]